MVNDELDAKAKRPRINTEKARIQMLDPCLFRANPWQVFGVGGLDAYAELHVLHFVAGVGVEVVWGAPVELVALAKFAANHQADRDSSEAGGKPANGAQDGRLRRLFFDRSTCIGDCGSSG